MVLYLDTSSLVKLYAEEAHSANIRHIVENAEVVATSRIAYAETRAAFARKFREDGMTVKEYRNIVQDINRDWENYFIVDVSDPLVKLAGQLAEKHALRGLDAIHLASSVVLRKQAGRPVTFSCFDDRLTLAARNEGLKVTN